MIRIDMKKSEIFFIGSLAVLLGLMLYSGLLFTALTSNKTLNNTFRKESIVCYLLYTV